MDLPTFNERSSVQWTPSSSESRVMREEFQKIIELAEEIKNIKVASNDDVTLLNLPVSDDQRMENTKSLIHSLTEVIKDNEVMDEERNLQKIIHEFFNKIDSYADTVVEAIQQNYAEEKKLKRQADIHSEYLEELNELNSYMVSNSETFNKLAELVKEDYREVRLDLKNLMKKKLDVKTMEFIKKLLKPHITDSAEDVWVTVSEEVDMKVVERLIRTGVATQRILTRSNKDAMQIKLVADFGDV